MFPARRCRRNLLIQQGRHGGDDHESDCPCGERRARLPGPRGACSRLSHQADHLHDRIRAGRTKRCDGAHPTRKMEELLKQPLVIENRAGAGGGIAGAAVARATPDGYTVLLATGSLLAINVSLYKNLGYDPEKDFEPITVIGTQTNVLYTHPSVPAKSLGELIDYARANPGKLTFGSGGIGTPTHLAGELLKMEAKLEMTHVPFRGTGPALQAVIGGHVPMAYNPPP